MFMATALPLLQTFAVTCAKPTFFMLVPWYQYLNLQTENIKNPDGTTSSVCQILNFNTDAAHVLGAHSPILLIGLAILDDLIRIAAFVAVGFVIYGGIQYVTSQGSPDATRKALQTIINALIGVVIAILAAAFVGFLGNKLGGLN